VLTQRIERRRLTAADLQRLPEAKDWTIATFCGGAAEFDLLGDRRADCGDTRAIDNMLERLQLAWSASRLAELRHQARRLVERERARIRTVAEKRRSQRQVGAAPQASGQWAAGASSAGPSLGLFGCPNTLSWGRRIKKGDNCRAIA